MIIALCIGRGQSKGLPGKNKMLIGNPPMSMMTYPIIAANSCPLVNEVFFSSDDRELKDIAYHYGSEIIDRPEELATDEALAEDVFVHGYEQMRNQDIEFLVLLFANAPCITSRKMGAMIRKLRTREEYDSVCTLSKYNMFAPYRARKFVELGLYGERRLQPFCPGIMDETTCDRNSGDDAWFYDCSCAVVRPYCLTNIESGLQPQRWLGEKILGYKQADPALDVDYDYQVFQVNWWLERNWM